MSAAAFSLFNQPTVALLNPLDIQAKRNALAMQGLQFEQQQRDIADDQAVRAAARDYYGGGGAPAAAPAPANALAAPAPAAAPAPSVVSDPAAGAVLPSAPAYNRPSAPGPQPAAAAPPQPPAVPARPPVPTMADLIQRGVPPMRASAMIQQFQKIDDTSADIASKRAAAAKANQEVQDAVAQQGSDMANMLVKTAAPGQPLNPDLLNWHLQHFASLGPQQAAAAQQVGAQLGPADQLAFLKSLAGTPKTIEANAAADTAKSKVDEVGNLTRKTDAELLDKAKGGLASALGSAQNQSDWVSILAKADPKVVAAMNIPPAFSKANQAAAVQQGQSANEQVQAAETARRDAAAAANEARARGQEQQNINLRQQEFTQRYSPSAVVIAPADLARIQAIHDGEIPAPSPRSAGFQKTMDQVYSLDTPDDHYTQARYDTKQNFKTKGDANTVSAIATALAHLDRAQTNSTALGWPPTQSLNITGQQHAYHQDADFLAGEVGKFVKNGELTQSEGDRIIGNLNSSLQSTRDAGLNETRELMGGKFQALRQKYVNGAGQDLPLTMFDAPTRARLVNQGLVSAPAAAPAAPAPAAPAPHGIPDLGSTFNGGKVVKVTRID